MAVVHSANLALAGRWVAYVGVGRRGGRYDHIYMYMSGYSSVARRGLRADAFVYLAYTRNKLLAEIWEAWFYTVFKPPYTRRGPRAMPRGLYAERYASVEEPVAMARHAEVVSPSSVGASTRLTEIIDGCAEKRVAVVHVEKPPPTACGVAEGA
ncbi:hypothetical protein [Pyrobaculum ferrireducens]|uniref:Uncharacterized protein n=1 Tax=Pyrobaculum ferrireducens TaxID=1104324 RepID=G7VBU2_9CREN|nr:hypothetical protein [Pyrobaculum ferrireducens]AET33709.1 hypothetical protein P186_2319 [Pyrobaculum ferrireducens]